MDIGLIVSGAIGVLAGLIVALKVIAPLTKTTVDDKILARLEQLEKMLDAATTSKK